MIHTLDTHTHESTLHQQQDYPWRGVGDLGAGEEMFSRHRHKARVCCVCVVCHSVCRPSGMF